MNLKLENFHLLMNYYFSMSERVIVVVKSICDIHMLNVEKHENGKPTRGPKTSEGHAGICGENRKV